MLHSIAADTLTAVEGNRTRTSRMLTEGKQLEAVIGDVSRIAEQFTEQVMRAGEEMDQNKHDLHQISDDARRLSENTEGLSMIVKRFKLAK